MNTVNTIGFSPSWSLQTLRANDQWVLTVKQHAFIVVVVILLRNFLLSVTEPFSQLLVHNFLNL